MFSITAITLSRMNIVRIALGLGIIGLLIPGLSSFENRFGPVDPALAQVETSANVASSDGRRCSNSTLAGKFAHKGDGVVPGGPPPAPMVPFATLSLISFDPAGTLTNDATNSLNGNVFTGNTTGTYSVESNCKGTMSILIPVPPFQLNFDIVVVDGGEEFYAISTVPSVFTSSGKRIKR